MRVMNKRIIVVIIAVLLIAGFGYGFRHRAQKDSKDKIQTVEVKRTRITNSISSSGKTDAEKKVDLKFQTSGRLAWVNVKEGDSVTAWQAIAGLDTREVEKNLKDVLLDYSNERNDFEETWRVTYGGKKPTDALTDTVKRILEKNQWDLEKAVVDVEIKHLAVEYATLVTPISGIVTHIDTLVAGVNITPATAVFTIADPSSIVFSANIDEVDVGEIKEGMKAEVRLDAFPDLVFSGTVSKIAFSSQSSSGGATIFPVDISFDEHKDNLRLGFNGDVDIILETKDNVLVVPEEAVKTDGDKRYVYVEKNGSYEKRNVSLGLITDDAVEITEGVEEGEKVVTRNFSELPKK